MDNSLVVHHIDNNKLNNNIENLTLITRTENTCLSFKYGLQMTVGNKFKTNCKVLTLKEIAELRHLKTMNYTNKRLSEIFGVSTRTVDLEVIDNTEKSEEQEVVEDLIQIITVFSCRLQGKRAKKTKDMIKELIDND